MVLARQLLHSVRLLLLLNTVYRVSLLSAIFSYILLLVDFRLVWVVQRILARYAILQLCRAHSYLVTVSDFSSTWYWQSFRSQNRPCLWGTILLLMVFFPPKLPQPLPPNTPLSFFPLKFLGKEIVLPE